MSRSVDWTAVIDEWRATTAPWLNPQHVLQDLVLSRIIVEFANDQALRRRLVLHGGTCLQKIWLDAPQRYSEDLDFLCVKPWHLPFVMRRMRRIAKRVGLADARFSFWGYPALLSSQIGGLAIDLKIDFNPTPKAARRALRNRGTRGGFFVESQWYSGETTLLPCASAVDILASKIAAIMTRNKARDLADLCAGIEAGLADTRDIVAVYRAHYHGSQHSPSLRARIDEMMSDASFRNDLTEGGDFIPQQFSPDSIHAVADSIDDALRSARHDDGDDSGGPDLASPA